MEFTSNLFQNIFFLFSIITTLRSQALNCKCMDYWKCTVRGGDIFSYCGISDAEVCCFLNATQLTPVNKAFELDTSPSSNNESPPASRKNFQSDIDIKNEVDNFASCGVSSSTGTLNSKSEFGEWPWHVAILESIHDLYLCGGALVSPDKIITGAHCVMAYTTHKFYSKLKVRAGEYDVSGNHEEEPHVESYVQEIKVHPNYNWETLENDIAILSIVHPLNFTRHIRPLCLPQPIKRRNGRNRRRRPIHRHLNRTCVVTGWGKISDASESHSVILKEVSTSILSHDLCEQKLRENFGSNYKLPMTNFCAMDNQQDPHIDSGVPSICDGDGGGALACLRKANANSTNPPKWTHEGIVSFGVGCGFGVYTLVEAYIEWINDIIAQ